MDEIFDTRHVTHDTALSSEVVFNDDASGITTTDDGETVIEWKDVERVTFETTDNDSAPPHAYGFDATEFYRLEATVARPIPQPYVFNDEVLWLKKPREELQKAAWTLDNRPWTMQHPETGLVQSIDDVRGFWQQTRYDTRDDSLVSSLHIPVTDSDAKDFIAENGDVSVGFQNSLTSVDEYDGIVGGEGPDVNTGHRHGDDIELDAYQTDMYFDHVASVSSGRCSPEDGCGINITDDIDGTFYNGTTIIQADEGSTSSVLTQTGQTMADSKFTHEGSWYAVPPEDNPDDEWKYVIDNCSDASDAWKLRSHGDISIEVSTLESRIKQRANDLGCDLQISEGDSAQSTTSQSDEGDLGCDTDFESDEETDADDSIVVNTDTITDDYDYEPNSTMSDDCGCNDGGLQVNFDDLSPDVALNKLAAEHDSIDEYLTDLREKASVTDEAAEELDVDIEQVADKAAMLDERVEELTETVDELQRPEMEQDAEAIIEATDRFGESVEEVIETCDADPEAVAAKRELIEDLSNGETTDNTANAGGSTNDGGEGTDGIKRGNDGYAVSPW
jgi:hypothetical protein